MTIRKEGLRLLQAIMLCIVATSPALTQGASFINMGWIVAMCLTPLLLLLRECRIWVPRIDIPAISFGAAVIFIPLICHADTFRWSTQLYTGACCCWAMALARLAKVAPLKRDTLINIIDGIVAAYLLTLIIQQICTLAGWQIFNPGMTYHSRWRLNSLMSEPSHTSWVLSILIFYRGLTIRRNKRRSVRKFDAYSTARTFTIWAAYLYVLFTVPNVSAYIWMPVALLPYLTRRNWAPLFGIAGCVLLILTVTTSFASNRQLQRYSRILFSLPTMNSEQISEADGSAATRIVPNIFGARAVGISTVDDWLGHGTDADMHDLPASTELTTVDDAGVFHVWYNYGIIAALLLWWLIAAIVIDRGEPFTLLMLFLALIQSAHCNGQLLWLLLSTAIIWMGCCGTSRKI